MLPITVTAETRYNEQPWDVQNALNKIGTRIEVMEAPKAFPKHWGTMSHAAQTQPCPQIAYCIEISNANTSDGHAPQVCLLFLGSPAAFRISRSPSASHLLAFTSCTTLMICLPAMIGKLTPAITHGQKESILLALANSNAPALWGLANRKDAEG